MALAVGDLVVVCDRDSPYDRLVGYVRHNTREEGAAWVGVEFDRPVPDGNELQGVCREGCGRYFNGRQLRKMYPLRAVLHTRWERDWMPGLQRPEDANPIIIIT